MNKPTKTLSLKITKHSSEWEQRLVASACVRREFVDERGIMYTKAYIETLKSGDIRVKLYGMHGDVGKRVEAATKSLKSVGFTKVDQSCTSSWNGVTSRVFHIKAVK